MAILLTANTASEMGGSTLRCTGYGNGVEGSSVGLDTRYTLVDLFDADYTSECAAFLLDTNNGTVTPFIFRTPEPAGDYWFHARVVPGESGSAGYADGHLYEFYDAENNQIARIDVNDRSFAPQAFGDTTVTGTGTSAMFTEFAATTIDIKIEVGANIVVSLYNGGTLVSTATAANTGGKGKPVKMAGVHNDLSQSFGQIPDNERWWFYSEVIITDGEPTLNWRLATMSPNAAGALSGLTVNPASLVKANDGATVNGDTDGEQGSWTLTAYNGPAAPSGIRAVVTHTGSATGLTGPQNLRHLLRIGGTTYDNGEDLSPAPGSTEIHAWDVNPATGSPWATADLANLEQGVEIKT